MTRHYVSFIITYPVQSSGLYLSIYLSERFYQSLLRISVQLSFRLPVGVLKSSPHSIRVLQNQVTLFCSFTWSVPSERSPFNVVHDGVNIVSLFIWPKNYLLHIARHPRSLRLKFRRQNVSAGILPEKNVLLNANLMKDHSKSDDKYFV